MPEAVKVAVLVSGSGSNLQAILDAQMSGALREASVVRVISSKPGVKALERAASAGITAVVAVTQAEVLEQLKASGAQVVCLAGYLKKLAPPVVAQFRGRILNIHPALLPKHGGPGMYGRFVHEAVLASGDKESGCSVHVVDEEYDRGPVLAQARVPVLPGDTAQTLAARVLEQEHRLYPKVLGEFCKALQ